MEVERWKGMEWERRGGEKGRRVGKGRLGGEERGGEKESGGEEYRDEQRRKCCSLEISAGFPACKL